MAEARKGGPGAAQVWSVAAAALVTGCLLWTARASALPALPALGWTAVFLFFAVEQDVRRRRIPNRLTGPALLAALLLGAAQGAWSGLLAALAGAGVALALLLLPFARGWFGAGDVKAAMVLGALWGSQHFVPALWWMIVAGGAIAVALLAAQGEIPTLLRHWARRLGGWLRLVRAGHPGLPAGSAARGGLPFALAMGLGASAQQLWGAPWA